MQDTIKNVKSKLFLSLSHIGLNLMFNFTKNQTLKN